MKKTDTQKQRSWWIALLVFGVVITPAIALAEVVPLAPLPTKFGGDTETLPGYVNTIFLLTISVGAVLAVLRIIWGGFRYMTSEAVGDVKEARSIIVQAIIGLLLLLGIWIILNEINPNITNLNALSFSPLENVTSPDLTAQRQEARELAQRLEAEKKGVTDSSVQVWQERFSKAEDRTNFGGNPVYELDVTGLTLDEKRALLRAGPLAGATRCGFSAGGVKSNTLYCYVSK